MLKFLIGFILGAWFGLLIAAIMVIKGDDL